MDAKKRTTEIINIFKKLNDLNLGISQFEEFDDFRKICNEFIREGKPVNGEIKVLGTKRIICYNFNNKVNCFLKFDETV
tara:strand:+ start:912 stop:1148 length:237 start_codon:yes stop_codon:yes gene_type:complete